MLIGDAASAFAVGLPLAWLLAFGLDLGIWGVLLARAAEELVKVGIFAWRTRKVVWSRVIDEQANLSGAN